MYAFLTTVFLKLYDMSSTGINLCGMNHVKVFHTNAMRKLIIIPLKLIRLKGQLLLLNHGLTHNFLRNLDYDPKFSNAAIQFFKNNKSELIQPLLFVTMIRDLPIHESANYIVH